MTIHDIPAEVGFLAGLCISLVLYGVYCALFAITIYTRRRCSEKNTLITCAVVALFALCTTIIALYISICYDALVGLPSMNPSTNVFFVDPLQPHEDWFPIKDVLLFCSNIIAEALLVWRLYIIWSKSWKVLILPVIGTSIVACGCIATAIIEFIVFLSSAEKAGKLIPVWSHVAGIGWTTTLCNNLLCTILITWKLWRIAHTAKGRGTARLANPAVSALIESGALYTGTVLCMTIFAATRMDRANFVIVAVLPVVLGIAPTSIVLRLNLIAMRKPTMTIQNDISVVQSGPTPGSSLEGQNGLIPFETALETTPEPVFAQPMTGLTSFRSGGPSIEIEVVHVEKLVPSP